MNLVYFSFFSIHFWLGTHPIIGSTKFLFFFASRSANRINSADVDFWAYLIGLMSLFVIGTRTEQHFGCCVLPAAYCQKLTQIYGQPKGWGRCLGCDWLIILVLVLVCLSIHPCRSSCSCCSCCCPSLVCSPQPECRRRVPSNCCRCRASPN